MCITANKIPGVRAALCHDTYSAERSRKSNDAQVITMGARVIGPELAKAIIDVWLVSEFAGGGSTAKVEKMKAVDERYRQRGGEKANWLDILDQKLKTLNKNVFLLSD